ncbi:13041_t:CDS:2 [Funneliformis geosporum]|uniref:13041_t:CDS:1 n=1 Tax=Funneliformis geosporum TaxID=1117311 RepID=A0A9W4SWK1_9GLOM|nr:13041_t:CDS:2 [Funneliformis geosporum]
MQKTDNYYKSRISTEFSAFERGIASTSTSNGALTSECRMGFTLSAVNKLEDTRRLDVMVYPI